MSVVRLARDLSLQTEAATQTFLIVGKRGSGKSSTGTRLAEQMIRAGIPIAVLDVVDVWWGLKAGNDGKSSGGLNVYVFGGDHADLPLEPTAGALMADVLVDHRISAVFVLRTFSNRDKARFVADFAEQLFKRNREVLHLFAEEAHEAMPQQPYRGEEEMLGRMLRLQKLGRTSGIGMTCITQRPASLNKNATTQAEVLIAHRILGPQDRDAIEAWIKYHRQEEHKKEVLTTLPELKTGEAWVWAPDFPEDHPLGLRRIKVLMPETFDSRRTPKPGERRVQPQALALVDLEKLRSKMTATIERAKAEDPRELRHQLAELRAELARVRAEKPTPATKEHRVDVRVVKPAEFKRAEKLIERAEKAAERLGLAQVGFGAEASRLASAIASARQQGSVSRDLRGGSGSLAMRVQPKSTYPTSRKAIPQRSSDGQPGTLGLCERKVLRALAQYQDDGCEINKLSLLSGYRQSGGFRNALATLRSMGLIVGGNKETMRITGVGLAMLSGDYEPLPTGQALIDHWLQHQSLDKCAREVLAVLVNAYPDGLAMERLAEKAGYEVSGGFRNALAKLRTAGLLVGRNRDTMRASPILFSK